MIGMRLYYPYLGDGLAYFAILSLFGSRTFVITKQNINVAVRHRYVRYENSSQ